MTYVYIVRSRASTAMVDEVDRHYRAEMRKLLGEVQPRFPNEIVAVSPLFCDIYDQASQAEAYQLHHIAGIGYGKAVEFLVKDYAKTRSPLRSSDIESMPLAKCIRTFLLDPNVRESSSMAAWLRNDEAHYARRIEGRDARDLKKLISLAVASIVAEMRYAERRETIEKLQTELSDGN
jgi:hypothetical protein